MRKESYSQNFSCLVTLSLVWLVLLCCGPNPAWAIQEFSSGMLTPETISPAPGTYGPTYTGTYFVPDPGRVSGSPAASKIWIVPSTGGNAATFAPTTQPLRYSTVGGLFLPNTSYWGNDAGKYLTTGWFDRTVNSQVEHVGGMSIYNADGTYRNLWEAVGHLPKTPVVAPAGWGNFGQMVIASDGGPAVFAIDAQGTEHTVSNYVGMTARFGLAFAPNNWGTVGGSLLASGTDGNQGIIFSIASIGTETPWKQWTLKVDQFGLRQMAFSPDGFIPGYDELLFVSVSGSNYGGGTGGDVLAFDENGNLVASLRQNLGLAKFDPRGLCFDGSGGLLISDASDPIYLATAQDFQLAPLPGSAFLLGPALLGLLVWRRRSDQS